MAARCPATSWVERAGEGGEAAGGGEAGEGGAAFETAGLGADGVALVGGAAGAAGTTGRNTAAPSAPGLSSTCTSPNGDRYENETSAKPICEAVSAEAISRTNA